MNQARRSTSKFFDRLKLIHNKDFACNYRGTIYQKHLFDLSNNNICEHLSVIRKQFRKVAYIGFNPETFLQNMPSNVQIDKFFVIDNSIKNLDISLEYIDKIKKENKYDFDVFPLIADEDIWPFEAEKLDLVVSSLNLHWVNDIQAALMRILDSLEPDGALIGNIFGEETLQELRIAFTLAESERSGGVSQHVSPMLSIVDFGNLFARCQYNLPTIFKEKLIFKMDSPFYLMEFLQNIGENNALIQSRKNVLRDVIYGTSAIYSTMFGDQEGKIPATFEIISFLGWKYHESQAKPKKRGSAEFSLKTLQKEIEESGDPLDNQEKKVEYGEIEVSDDEEVNPNNFPEGNNNDK